MTNKEIEQIKTVNQMSALVDLYYEIVTTDETLSVEDITKLLLAHIEEKKSQLKNLIEKGE